MAISQGGPRAGARSQFEHVEFPSPLAPRQQITHVLFDFDGTLSLVREGWPGIMLELFLGWLPGHDGDDQSALRAELADEIMQQTGKPTIDQMHLLVRRIQQRGGTPREPEWYKERFLERLDERRNARIADLQSGRISNDALLVHQSRPLLDHLQSLGLQLYLASGTDDPSVKREAELLGIAHYFGRHMYGALPDPTQFSKRLVLERMMREDGITGDQILAFGDGLSEIEATKAVGGVAVAVASDEAHNGSGRIDQRKRAMLLALGADAVIPDFREAIGLVDFLLGRA
jgi:phosphoglycolate phosphatase